MKQKAHIDIIDVAVPDSDLEEGIAKAPEPDPALETSSPRKIKPRWIWISGALMFVVVAIASLWYLAGGHLTGEAKKEHHPAASVAALISDHLQLDGFFIAVHDEQGKPRILQCGIILDIDRKRHREILEKEVEIRKAIYQTVQKRPSSELLRPDEKRILKKDISDELNKLLGAGAVKAVYLDRYILL